MAAEIISKQCGKCKVFKLVSEFHKDARAKTGYRSYCIECCRKYRNSENGQQTENRYRQSAKARAVWKRYNHTKKGKKRTCIYIQKYRLKFPERILARMAVQQEIRRGTLTKPSFLSCKKCDKNAKQYHHYNGYKKAHWLDVIPVCQKCHRKQVSTFHFRSSLF